MKISICLALAALTILPNLAMALTEIDDSEIQFARISDEENDQMMAVNYRDYFAPGCRHQIVLDLSPLDFFPQVQKDLKKIIEAKGHKAMLEPRDDSFPLKTIYFSAGESRFLNIGKRQINYNKQAQMDIQEKLQDEHAKVSMADLEKTLLPDEVMKKRNFQLVVGLDVKVKEHTASREIIEIDKANMREKARELGDEYSRISTIPEDFILVEATKRFATAQMNGLAFKELQRLALKKALNDPTGKAHGADRIAVAIEKAVAVEDFDKTQQSVYKAIVVGLPNCGNRAALKPSSKK